MLKEITKIRQEKNGFRRWFQDEDLELVIWYELDEKIKNYVIESIEAQL